MRSEQYGINLTLLGQTRALIAENPALTAADLASLFGMDSPLRAVVYLEAVGGDTSDTLPMPAGAHPARGKPNGYDPHQVYGSQPMTARRSHLIRLTTEGAQMQNHEGHMVTCCALLIDPAPQKKAFKLCGTCRNEAAAMDRAAYWATP